MKTLFQYGDKLNSRDLNLALASLIGVGPICGFNEASINGNTLSIQSTRNAQLSGIYRHVLWDKVNSRFVNQLEDGGNTAIIQHGVIARDGYMYLDDSLNITVPIQNSRSVNTEVLLFAQHISVSDPISNPVNLVAYFSTSSDSFYANHYLPQLNGDLTQLYNTQDNYGINFQKLEDQAFNAIPVGNVSKENSVLVGIYGIGFNTESGVQERFSIVPYHGEFPTRLSYNVLIHNHIMNLTNRVSRLENK